MGASPTTSQSLGTLRPDIGQALEAFDLAMDRQQFIGTRILPVLEVGLQADQITVIPAEQYLQARGDIKRAADGSYAQTDFEFSKDTYSTDEHGISMPIDDRLRRKYENLFDAELIGAEIVRDIVARELELRIAALLFSTGTFGSGKNGTVTGGTWDNAANATPIAAVEAAVTAVKDNCGLWPNTMVISRRRYRKLRMCEEIQERIAAFGAGDKIKATDITPAMLAQVFDLEQVLIAGGTYNSAKKGQTPVFGEIWSSDYALVCKAARTNNMAEPCVGRVFHWGRDGSVIGGAFDTYYSDANRCNTVRCRHDVDEKILLDECGYLITDLDT